MKFPTNKFFKQLDAENYMDKNGGYMFKLIQSISGSKQRHHFCVIPTIDQIPFWIKESHGLKCEIVESIFASNYRDGCGTNFYFDIDCFRVEKKGKLMAVPECKPGQIMEDFEDCFDHCVRALTNVGETDQYSFNWSYGATEDKYSFHLTVSNPDRCWVFNSLKTNPGRSQKKFVEFMKHQILEHTDRWRTLRQIEDGKPNSIVDESPYCGKRSNLRIPTGYSHSGRVLLPCEIGDNFEVVLLETFEILDYLNNVKIDGRTGYEIMPEVISNLQKSIMNSYAFLDDDEPEPRGSTPNTPHDDQKASAVQNGSVENGWLEKKLRKHHQDISRFIEFRLENVAFRDFHTDGSGKPIVRLKNIGTRKCPLGGELNEGDNAWLRINKFCNAYYGCSNSNCKGRQLFVGKLENVNFMPYRFYSDMDKIPRRAHKDFGKVYHRSDIEDFCKCVYTHIRKPVDDYILIRHHEVFSDDRNTLLRDVYTEILTAKFKETRKWLVPQKDKTGVEKLKPISLKTILLDLISFDKLNPLFSHSRWIPYAPSRMGNMPNYHWRSYNTFIPTKIGFRPKVQGFDIKNTAFDKLTFRVFGKKVKCQNYFYNWLAFKLQNPTQNPNTAIGILNSTQGAGKGTLFGYMNALIGAEFCLNTSCLAALLGRFQSELDKKLIICLEELSSGGQAVSCSNKLKELVCKPFGKSTMKVEFKGRSGLQYINYYASYLFFSNNSMCLKLETTDRRYMVVTPRQTAKELKDRSFWNKCWGEVKDLRFITGLYQFFVGRDISNFDPTDIPMTPLRKEMMNRSKDNVACFLQWFLSPDGVIAEMNPMTGDKTLEDCENACPSQNKEMLIIPRKHVFDRYKFFCSENNEKALRKNIILPNIFGQLRLDHGAHDLRREPMHVAGFGITQYSNNRKDSIGFPVKCIENIDLLQMIRDYKFA